MGEMKPLKPTGVRAQFLSVMIGMAKDCGYTQRQLLREIRECWRLVPDPPTEAIIYMTNPTLMHNHAQLGGLFGQSAKISLNWEVLCVGSGRLLRGRGLLAGPHLDSSPW
jgi:hypothetical protein